MSVSLEQVRHIALLSRLEFTDEELEKFTRHLNEILGYAEKVNELDTSNVPPTTHAVPMSNVFREDQVQESLSIQEVLANSACHNGSLIIVPKVTE